MTTQLEITDEERNIIGLALLGLIINEPRSDHKARFRAVYRKLTQVEPKHAKVASEGDWTKCGKCGNALREIADHPNDDYWELEMAEDGTVSASHDKLDFESGGADHLECGHCLATYDIPDNYEVEYC